MRLSVLLLANVFATAFPAAESAAQAIRGRLVDDSTGIAVPGAIISLLDASGGLLAATHSDSGGEFQLSPRGEGRYRLRARVVGYMDATTELIELGAADSIEVRFVVSRDVVLLEPIEVTAKSRPLISGMSMAGYHERRAKGLGYALTREDIDKRHARAVSDLLRMVPGVRVDGRFGDTHVSIPGAGQRMRSECPVKVLVDGIEFRWGSTTIDDISTHDIEAIEVFRNLAELPPEMGGNDADCGVIAIWTRRGTDGL